MEKLKKWKWCDLILSLAVLALGLCLIFFPRISAQALCTVLGMMLMLIGIARLISYFRRGVSVLWHRYELPLGLIDALLGIYFCSHPQNVQLILPVVAGMIILIDSIFSLQTASELRRAQVRHWWIVLLLSAAGIAASVILIRNPFEGSAALMIALGISLVIDGVQSLWLLHTVIKNLRRLAPIEAEYHL